MASVENDAIFEFLHMEIVSQVLRHEKEISDEKEKEDLVKSPLIAEAASSAW